MLSYQPYIYIFRELESMPLVVIFARLDCSKYRVAILHNATTITTSCDSVSLWNAERGVIRRVWLCEKEQLVASSRDIRWTIIYDLGRWCIFVSRRNPPQLFKTLSCKHGALDASHIYSILVVVHYHVLFHRPHLDFISADRPGAVHK